MSLTKADIEERYGVRFLPIIAPIPDDEEGVDDVAVGRALSDALNTAYSYIASRCPTPIDPLPDVLKRACVDMAVYWLAESAGQLTDERRQRHEDAIGWLKAISHGHAVLDVATGGGLSALQAEFVKSDERMFRRRFSRINAPSNLSRQRNSATGCARGTPSLTKQSI